eukprot:1368715-Rhodomonas_salina.1
MVRLRLHKHMHQREQDGEKRAQEIIDVLDVSKMIYGLKDGVVAEDGEVLEGQHLAENCWAVSVEGLASRGRGPLPRTLMAEVWEKVKARHREDGGKT